MNLRDQIALEIARQLIEQHPLQKGQPAPAAKEVEASAYPPRTVESWCIPIPRSMVDHHPRATWTSEIADLEKTVGSLWLDRDPRPWTNGQLAAHVWHGYHAETHTIYYAIHLARLPDFSRSSLWNYARTRTP